MSSGNSHTAESPISKLQIFSDLCPSGIYTQCFFLRLISQQPEFFGRIPCNIRDIIYVICQNCTIVQRKYFLLTGLILLLVAGSVWVSGSSSHTAAPKTGCPNTSKECCTSMLSNRSSGEMIWETLSRQFFSDPIL